MSIMRPILNTWLRLIEKPHMARAKTPGKLRRSFEVKAKLFFHGPLGTTYQAGELAGLDTLKVIPKSGAGDHTVLYFHGGAYIFGSPRTHSAMIANLMARSGGDAILPAYRKAPEHPFPAAPDDALAAYRAIIEGGIDPARIIVGGDSAGGGLALSLLGQILEQGLPIPAGVFAFSPVVDMTYASASVVENEHADVVLPASQIQSIQESYLGETDPSDPRASPLNAQFGGACRVWLCVGDTEILRDDTVRMAAALEAAGVPVNVTVEHDLPHVWPLFHNLLPEARATLEDLSRWIRQRLPH